MNIIYEVYLSFIYRLNKLGTNAHQNISYPQFINLMNKAQLHWAEERIKVSEADIVRTDEVQQLLKEINVSSSRVDDIYSFNLPEDYFHFKRSYSKSKKCNTFVNNIQVEEGNINTLLVDEFSKPSEEWGETLLTIVGNKIKIYSNFDLVDTKLIYYRLPKLMDIAGYTSLGGPSTNIDPEWTGSNLEEIIDLAVRIASGDIGDQLRFQMSANHEQKYN